MIVNKSLKGLEKVSKALAFSLFFIMLSSVIAGATPPLPCAFYGKAEINGRDMPAGSVITAKIDGVVKGTITLDSSGKYGGETFNEGKLYTNGNDGDTLEFFAKTPEMTNEIKASETAEYEQGGEIELDLTFNGEEIKGTPSSGSESPGSGGSESPETGGEEEETPDDGKEHIASQSKQNDIDDDFQDSGTAEVSLSMGDSVTFTFKGETKEVKLKSFSDFAVLLTVSGSDVIIDLGETRSMDLDGDGVDDISVTLESIEGSKANLVFEKLAQPFALGSIEGVTGMMTGAPGLYAGVIIVIVLVIIAGFMLKRRGSI